MSPSQLIERIQYLHETAPCFDQASLLADDEAMRLNDCAKTLLDEAGAPLHLIPVAEGGELSSMQELMLVLRAVCANDLSFGLGYILTSFMAATNLWVAGNREQRAIFSALLRQGKKISIGYHELAHGNDLNANELTARAVQGGFVLNGRKEVINNAALASAVVLHARTSDEPGIASHSLFFVRLDTLGAGCRVLSRFRTHGARTCQIAGFEFSNCFIPSECLMGNVGGAFSYASKAFQISRAILPGASLGVIDYALRMATRYCANRNLYGATALDIPYVRAVLAETYLELCIADKLSRAMSACLHVLPAQMSVYSALCKYIVPRRMMRALKQLSTVFGAAGYVREGNTALFEKILRDYPVLSLGHASSRTCEAIVAAQLHTVLGREAATPDLGLMSLIYGGGATDAFSPSALRGVSTRADPLLDSPHLWLRKLHEALDDGWLTKKQFSPLAELARRFVSAVAVIKNMNADENARDIGDAVERYALLHCGIALFNDWIYSKNKDVPLSCDIVMAGLSVIDAHLNKKSFSLDSALEKMIVSQLVVENQSDAGALCVSQ